MHPTTPGSQPVNQLLTQLSDGDRETLLSGAHQARLPVGHTILCAGDAMLSAYFPDTGVLSLVSEMATGHQVAVDIVGADGMIGFDALFHTTHPGYRVVILAETDGYWIAADRLRRLCANSDDFRSILLTHIGSRMSEIMITAACNRVHSHRQRLARWLLIATDKAGRRSLDVTHETLAQLVGGPRHAVTVALNEFGGRERLPICEAGSKSCSGQSSWTRHANAIASLASAVVIIPSAATEYGHRPHGEGILGSHPSIKSDSDSC